MKKTNNIFMKFFLCYLILAMLFTNFQIASAATIPTPSVSSINSNYETGDTLKLNITASGNTKVQYKVTLTNSTNKKTYSITSGFTKTSYNPKSAYSVSYQLKDQGKYTLSISSKIAGASDKSCKTITKTFYVWDKSVIISSIDPINKTVNIDDTFTFPTKVTAKMKDGSTKELDVVWDKTSIDTSKAGVQTITGTIKGYTYKVTLNVNVLNEKILSVDDINATVDEGSSYNLPETSTAHLSNGTSKSVSVKWNVSSVDTSKAGTYTYLGDVDGYKDKVKLNITVKEVPFVVNSITCTNLKEVRLVFSKKLDITTVISENLRVYKGSTYIPTSASLLGDDKTVVLTVTASGWNFDNSVLYSVVVENVKDTNGKKIDRTVKDFTAVDNTSPEAVSASAASPSTINIVFSEPIKNTGTGTIDVTKSGNIVYSYTTYSGYDTNIISFDLKSNMVENAQYDITVKGFKDFAGNEMASKTVSFVYKKDTTAITAKVRGVNQSIAIIKFSKPVIWLTKNHFYHTSSSYVPLGIYKNPEMTTSVDVNTPVDTVWVKFYDDSTKKGYPITSSVQKIILLGTSNNYTISDRFGNTFSGGEIPINVTIDSTPISVVSLKQDTDTSLYVEFNKEVNLTSSNVDIIDKSGNKVYITSVTAVDEGTKYRIVFNEVSSGTNISVTLSNIEDKNNSLNKLNSYTQDLTITDKTPPKVIKVTKKFVTGLDQCLYVLFNESLNNTALDISKYYLQNPSDGTMKKLTKTPSFENSDRMVKIDLTDDEKKYVESGYNLFVKDVEDKYNNILPGQIILNSNFITFGSTDSKPQVVKIEATSRTTVNITFDQYLKYVDAGAFKVNGTAVAGMSVSTNDDGNTVVTLTAASGTENYTDNGIWMVYIYPDSTNKLQNSFGLSVNSGVYTSSSTIKIQDKIPPQVKYVNGMPQITTITGTSGIIDSIVIEYDDEIDMTRLSALSYDVKGRTIKKVYTNTSAAKTSSPTEGRFVIIELKTDSTTENLKSIPSVAQVLDIYDTDGNKLSPDGKYISPGEYTGPTVINKISSQIEKGQSTVLRFSQDLTDSSKIVVQNAITAASNGKGILSYYWTTNSILIITNSSTVESTNFDLTNQIKVTITDVNGKTTTNVVIIGK